ncbi:hypothetical protein [Rhizobium sp. BK008]|uniref:hypothetical protein n=1 Tax=Rhizobium sp. BK008 TaxID=2587094 RepID=UPI00161007B6|nr:hypothetical protein [Rhizobium sp. BK008]MBB4254800.1 hypothetical protein [Rhizobium sp. BK008]
MSALIYRRAFSDSFGLKQFLEGVIPDIEDIRRRIFVTERRSDTGRPDHFYKNYLHARIGDVAMLHELPLVVLSALAKRFLVRSANGIHVRNEAFEDWQELLPSISPLAVVVAFLVNEGRGPAFGSDPCSYLAALLGDTALVSPLQPELQLLIETDGLNEMHMHLNGSTELDILWPDAVRSPDMYYRALSEAQNDTGQRQSISELYDQMEFGMKPKEIFQRLRSARRVRHLVAKVLGSLVQGGKHTLSPSQLKETARADVFDYDCPHTSGLPLGGYPITSIFPAAACKPIVAEAAFLYTWFQALRLPTAQKDGLGTALYFNLLVLTQFARISVQQIDEFGFDQFQKYTFVGVRESLERRYEARFRQLNQRPPYDTIKHLEGRIAPKKDVAAFLGLVEGVVDGYLRFRGCPSRISLRGLRGAAPGCMTGGCAEACHAAKSGHANGELSLVVHFIKRQFRQDSASQVLDLQLRSQLRQQAKVVQNAMKRHRLVRELIRGIDAAANELHAAPEVFAPVFRNMRYSGIERATYHVGEDFVHLVSGIRACFEALSFLPLTNGDRMGHATALGIRPGFWLERTGPRLMMAAGEHLDNLVYAYNRLVVHPDTTHEAMMLEEQIAVFSAKIYGKECTPTLLHQSWKLRELDVLEISNLERSSSHSVDAAGMALAAGIQAKVARSATSRAELERIEAAARLYPAAYELFRERHRRIKQLGVFEEVTTAWLSPNALVVLQADALANLASKGVVIETLPTSNVRISAYDSLKEHHLFRWLNLTGEEFSSVPPICVGSDDTGIFATSLRNEYASLLEVLKRQSTVKRGEEIEIIRKLNSNGAAFRFRPVQRP